MSIFEKRNTEAPLIVSKKIITAWMIAADNEINAIDLDLYESLFGDQKDLKSYIDDLNLYNNDLLEACSILSTYYIDKKDEALEFLNSMISFSFSNKKVFPYEKIILECLRKVFQINDMSFSVSFEKITKTSFFPVGNVSAKEWWLEQDDYYSDDFVDFYSLLDISMKGSSQDIRLKIQQKENSLNKQVIDNIEYVLLNSKRREVYNKYVLYSGVVERILSYKGKDGTKEPIFIKKEHVKIKTNHLLGGAGFVILISLLNIHFDFVRIGPPDVVPIELNNYIETKVGSTEVVADTYKAINTDKLHLRSGPGIESPVISVLSKGDRVKVISESNGWSKVYYSKDLSGWMATSHLATLPK